jgi:phage terminase small subunit
MKHTNEAEAYRLAGYRGTGNTARVNASKILKKANSMEYLAKLGEKATARAEKTADEVIAEIEKLAFSNMGNYVKFDKNSVTITDSSKLTPEQLACIAEVSEVESVKGGRHLRFKLHDKKGSLELLARRLRLINEPSGVKVYGGIVFTENRPPPKSTKQSEKTGKENA